MFIISYKIEYIKPYHFTRIQKYKKTQIQETINLLINNSDFPPIISQLYAIACSMILELICMIFLFQTIYYKK